MNADCGKENRTVVSARECKCEACKRWWCDHVPGYFYCEKCGGVTLECMSYGDMCEECYDDAVYEEVSSWTSV